MGSVKATLLTHMKNLMLPVYELWHILYLCTCVWAFWSSVTFELQMAQPVNLSAGTETSAPNTSYVFAF